MSALKRALKESWRQWRLDRDRRRTLAETYVARGHVHDFGPHRGLRWSLSEEPGVRQAYEPWQTPWGDIMRCRDCGTTCLT